MLSLFALPKAFEGHIGVIQRNAVQSWIQLGPRVEILLMGDEPGVSGVAKEFGLRHIQGIRRNEFGTPLVDDLFEKGEKEARSDLLCYVNADIILMPGFLPALERAVVQRPRSLLVGYRWDLDVRGPLDFSGPWVEVLRKQLKREGRRHSHTGIDCFVFPRGLWERIPPFAIGRSAWDNWLLYEACRKGYDLIDISQNAVFIHQNHSYSATSGMPGGIWWKGPEAERNLELAGGYSHLYTLLDARHCLGTKGLRRRFSPYFLYRKLVHWSDRSKVVRSLLSFVRPGILCGSPSARPWSGLGNH